MNTNFMNKQIIQLIKYDFKGHLRSHKVTFMYQRNIFVKYHFV